MLLISFKVEYLLFPVIQSTGFLLQELKAFFGKLKLE
jgi:hypothetical protein